MVDLYRQYLLALVDLASCSTDAESYRATAWNRVKLLERQLLDEGVVVDTPEQLKYQLYVTSQELMDVSDIDYDYSWC